MTNPICNKLKMLLRDRLTNLNVVLFDHHPRVEEIGMISANLDNLLVKLIQNGCLTEKEEDDLRLLINELNRNIYLQSFSTFIFDRQRVNDFIKNLIF